MLKLSAYWYTPPGGPRSGAMSAVGELNRLRKRAHLDLVIVRAQAVARLVGAEVEFDLPPDVEFGSRVRFRVQPGTRNVVKMGGGCAVHDDVLFLLKGGTVVFGDTVEIRRGTVLNVSGRLHLVGRNIISYHNIIHCAESITFDLYSSTNEFVSIIDSTHDHDGPHEFFYENVRSAPIAVGRNTWICSKSSVLMGVRIGHNSVVGANSVVNRDVADGVVVAGLPAKEVAKRRVGGPALEFFSEPVA